MPARRHTSRPRHSARITFEPGDEPRAALLVIDETPLKQAAWAELHAARRRQERAAQNLHRHEEVDSPAYDAWLHRTFPTLISSLRELHEEVFAKGQRVRLVQEAAAFSGRSARKIWREQKEREASPNPSASDHDRGREEAGPDEDDFFRAEDDAEDRFGGEWEDAFERGRGSSPRPHCTPDARDVYRRLVQRLHPDRGGEWTAARQRLWHDVQQAWATGDADWLMRLEIEWEAAHDALSPASALSRLRAAIDELHAARRDLERKLRRYRDSPAWRFSLAAKKREELQRRTEMNFRREIAFLDRQRAHLNALIASWEEPRKSRRAHPVEVRFCG